MISRDFAAKIKEYYDQRTYVLVHDIFAAEKGFYMVFMEFFRKRKKEFE